MSAKCRHSLYGRQTWTVRSFEREERDFTRQQRFPMEGAIFWGIRFDGRTRKIGESIRRGEAIRHGSVILMPFSRSTRPRPAARWFFLLPPASCFLPSFSSPRLTDFPTLLRSLAPTTMTKKMDTARPVSKTTPRRPSAQAAQRQRRDPGGREGGRKGGREGMAKAAVITSPACAISEMAGDMGPYA